MKTFVATLLICSQPVLHAEEEPMQDQCTRIGISGRILDEVTGAPIKDAKVWFQYQFMTSALAMRFPGEATTDAQGRFKIPSEFRKSKYKYGSTDDPSDTAADKPDVPIKIQGDHPDYQTFRYEFPTKQQNKKLSYLRQTYPIFTDGADYKMTPATGADTWPPKARR